MENVKIPPSWKKLSLLMRDALAHVGYTEPAISNAYHWSEAQSLRTPKR